MSRSRIKTIGRLLGTVIAIVLLAILLRQQGWAGVIKGIRSIEGWRFGVAIALMVLSRVAVASRWHVLLKSADIPIRIVESFRITFAGLFASNFLPTTIGGDVVRLTMMLRSGRDSVISTASLIIDRLVGMAGMATASPFGIAPVITSTSITSSPYLISMSALAAITEKVKDLFRRVLEALKLWFKTPRGLLGAYLWTWVHQLCVFGIVWLFFQGMDESISFGRTAGLWSLTYFAALIPISINGYGLQELSMTALFSTFGGVSINHAAVAALLIRTLQMLVSVPGAVFLPDILEGRRRQEVNEKPDVK